MNTHELAWAAGLIDGEGCFAARWHRHYFQPRLDITQVDRYVLDRFCRAVGVGKVYGPYLQTQRNRQPRHQYVAVDFEKVQTIVAMVWPWLSPVKRVQAQETILKCRTTWKGLKQKKNWTHCSKGHALDAQNRYVSKEGRVGCRKCSAAQVARSRERRRLRAI